MESLLLAIVAALVAGVFSASVGANQAVGLFVMGFVFVVTWAADYFEVLG